MSKLPFVLELKLQTAKKDDYELNKRFFYAFQIKNVIISHCQRMLNKLKYDTEYRNARLAYYDAHEKGDEKARKSAASVLREKVKEVGLTKSDLEHYAMIQARKFSKHLDAQTVQSLVNDVYKGVEKILYGDGKQLHHKRAEDITSVSGKSNKQGIRFRSNRIEWLGLNMGIQLDVNDKYAREALKHKVLFCRIIRRVIGVRWHFYVQLVLEGIPPIKHKPGTGDVGIDNGPSVFAVCSEKQVSFEVLGTDTSKIDIKIQSTQQAIDRSMRAMNPQNYNPDGTVKKNHKRWNYSRRCKTLRRRLNGLYEKKAAIHKQQCDGVANRIMAQGDRFVTEPVNFKALQKRAQKTTINQKTGLPNSKKRYGKSIGANSPAAVLTTLKRKLGYFDIELEYVNIFTYRASQFNHITGGYTKKKLSERWVKIGDCWIQRDLYSAFLLFCATLALGQIDRGICSKRYDIFKKLHDSYIEELVKSEVVLPSCCGIHHTKKLAV